MKGKLLEYKGYYASTDISFEDGCLFGKVEFINDSIVFGAESPKALEEQFYIEIDEYLELCKEVGKVPDKTMSGTFNVRLGPDLHKKALIKSKQENTSLNEVVKCGVEQYVNGTSEIHNHINIHPNDNSDNDVYRRQFNVNEKAPALRLVN